MYWFLLPALLVLAALFFLLRAGSRPRRRRTPHTYVPPCIEK